jgi:hypothetical protein
VTLFRHPQTGVVWAAAGAHTGRGCGDFEAELWAVFEGAGAGPRRRWIRRSDPDSGRLSPEAAFDIDGDGVPELVSPLNLAARDHEGTFGVVEAFSFPYFDCPC